MKNCLIHLLHDLFLKPRTASLFRKSSEICVLKRPKRPRRTKRRPNWEMEHVALSLPVVREISLKS